MAISRLRPVGCHKSSKGTPDHRLQISAQCLSDGQRQRPVRLENCIATFGEKVASTPTRTLTCESKQFLMLRIKPNRPGIAFHSLDMEIP